MRLVTRLRQLDRQQRRDLWPAAWRLLVVRAMLMLSSIDRTQCRLGGVSAGDSATFEAHIWQRRALALKRVGAALPGTRCLARALALRWWMRNAGLPAHLRIGVPRDSARPSSHAWVECADVPVDEDAQNLARFRVIDWRE